METDQLASVDNVLASRSLPPAIRASIETLLEEYAQMERIKASWLLQEATLKAKIEAMEREKVIESKARASLAARVGMLEYALKENRCPDPGGDSSMIPVKLNVNSDMKNGKSIPESPSPLRASFSDKYKTLPSNFLSRNPVNSGTKMLWKYLEELGYKPLTSASNNSLEIEQENQPTALPEMPAESLDASKPPQSSKISSGIEKDEPSAGLLAHDATDRKLSNDDGYEETVPVLGQLLPRAQAVPSLEASVDQGYSFEWICSSSFGSQWKPKLTMTHHLDAVRSIQFHDSMPIIFTGSEDGTAKIWNIDDNRGNRRLQPVHTYRGHSCMISSVTIQGSSCVSASVDGKIIVWSLPSIDNEDMYDAQLSANKFRKMILNAHTNAVWDLHIVASELMYSCGADGFVHVWDVSRNDSHPTPKYSFQRKDDNGAIVPGQSCSSVSTLTCDPNKILVSYTSGHLEILDAFTGQLIRSMKQIPRIVRAVSHPIHPLVLCASVDNTVLFCDVNAGTYVHRMLAHAQPVTSIAVSGDGSSMMSACHDSSIRFWDLTKRCCCQDLSAHQTHRRKYGEAIHSVAYHPSLDLAASGGADCAVKIYQN